MERKFRWLGLWFALVVITFVSTSTEASGNWPNWRGPTRDGSASGVVPIRWDTEKNVSWRVQMPEWTGSTPIVWKDRIFLNVADGDNVELWCLERETGQLLWKRLLSTGNHQQRKQNMSSPSPVTDGRYVWVMTGTGILRAFDFSGHEIWMRDIPEEYGEFGLNWGYASSPLLDDNTLYIQVLHGMKTDDPSYLLKIDASNGATVWRKERPTQAVRESPDAYTTPALFRYMGVNQVVVTGGDAVTGHDPENGEELWRVNGLNPTGNRSYRIVASPVVIADMIVAPTRVRPLLAMRIEGLPDDSQVKVLWQAENGPDVPTPVTDGDYLYIVNDQGIVYVHELDTGKLVYGRKRLQPGTYSASPVLVGGRIYVTNESGLTSVFRSGPEFEILAENALEDYTLSSPAVSEGQIFIRTANYLYAIGEWSSGVSENN